MGLLADLARERRDIVQAGVPGLSVVIITNAELAHEALVARDDSFTKAPGFMIHARPFLGDGLLTSHGAAHRRQRKVLAPRFTPAAIARLASTMAGLTRGMLASWRTNPPRRLSDELSTLSATIAARTIFSLTEQAEARLVCDALDLANRHVADAITALIRLPRWMPTPRNRRFRAALTQVDDLVFPLIRERRARRTDHDDILSALLAARDEDGRGMDDQIIRDQVITLVLAGTETVASSVAWTFHLLSRSPEHARAVASEVDAVLADRDWTVEDMGRLPFTTRVWKEALRLMPAAYVVTRMATRDVVVGRYTIPRGSWVVVNIFGQHRRAGYFEAPDEMRPERFACAPTWPSAAYLPFGVGPRTCIGNHFAMMEGILVLAHLARAVEFHGVDQAVGMDPLLTLRPRGGMPFRVHWRSSWPTGS
jgi:cytochrome P450